MNKGKICVSVCAETANELIKQIAKAKEFADIIEIRFDNLTFVELDKFLHLLKQEKIKTYPMLAAMHKSVNSQMIGEYNIADNFPVWEKILDSKIFDYFDPFQGGTAAILIEHLNNSEHLSPDLKQFFENAKKHKFIFSYHNFEISPEDLEKRYDSMKTTPADIIKIAVQTNDITDSIAIWKLLKSTKQENKPLIPIAMGEAGKWTRILGLAHGAFMTYASLNSGNETAPGQVSAKDLIEIYRIKELDETTEVYGIIGNPVSHSVSPEMQNAAFKFHNLNAVYIPFEVKCLDQFMARMVKPETREIDLNFKGFSVTLPHKQSIIKHLDFIDETAQKIGAVNTIKIVDGKLHGYNTDSQGFIEPLKNTYGNLKDANIAVLGAGGSARACVYALKKEGANVTIFARNVEKAESLANEFKIELMDLSNLKNQFSKINFDIIVNSTPIGMKGKFESETPVIAEQIENVKLVYDLVFNPFQTNFMTEADKANVPKIAGMAMLVAQGIEQFKIWTGKAAPMKEMSQAVLQKLQK